VGTREHTWIPLCEAAAGAAGMVVFALRVHRGPAWASAGGLAVAAVALGHCVGRERDRWGILGLRRLPRGMVQAAVLGALIGVVLGVIYRLRYDWGMLPPRLTWFALAGAAIGATEEGFYRGYVQGRLRRLGPVAAVALAALAHTAYKCALFAVPPSPIEMRFVTFGLVTFLGGVFFGVLRERSGSVVPPLLAHACFDIIVYGDRAVVPWWVWS